jgi:ribosomal 30S subunit maturation factor RimM
LAGRISSIPVGNSIRLDDDEYRVVRSTVRDSERLILECDGLWKREQIEHIIASSIYIPRSSVSPEHGMFPLFVFIGLKICSGDLTWEVVDIEPTLPNPQLLLRGGNGVFPVPLNLVLSGEIDWVTGSVGVDLPEGLEELAEEQ